MLSFPTGPCEHFKRRLSSKLAEEYSMGCVSLADLEHYLALPRLSPNSLGITGVLVFVRLTCTVPSSV